MILDGFYVTCPSCKKMHTAQINLVCTCGSYVPTFEKHHKVPSKKNQQGRATLTPFSLHEEE